MSNNEEITAKTTVWADENKENNSPSKRKKGRKNKKKKKKNATPGNLVPEIKEEAANAEVIEEEVAKDETLEEAEASEKEEISNETESEETSDEAETSDEDDAEAEPEQEAESEQEAEPENETKAEEAPRKRSGRKHKAKSDQLKYTVLLVPNNNHRVKQFDISFDLILSVSMLIAVIIFAVVIYVSGTASNIDSLESSLSSSLDQNEQLKDEIVLLQAKIEDMESSLREAKVTIDANKTIQQEQAKEQTKASIPTGFPIDNAASIPSEYSADTQYVELTTGFGTKLVAAADGTVESVDQDPVYGYKITLDYGNGYKSVYLIKSAPTVSAGDKVIRGSTLCTVDSDNQVLAYQITFNEIAIDPMTVIEING